MSFIDTATRYLFITGKGGAYLISISTLFDYSSCRAIKDLTSG